MLTTERLVPAQTYIAILLVYLKKKKSIRYRQY